MSWVSKAKIITAEDKRKAEVLKKKEALQAEKCKVRDSGIVVDGTLFDTDHGAVAAYMQFYFELMGNPSAVVSDWKASSGVWVEMNGALLAKIMAGLRSMQKSVFSWQKEKEKEFTDAVNKGEDVSSISTKYGE